MGHEERLPPSRLSGCCRFGQETVAGPRGNGQDAPISVVPPAAALDQQQSPCTRDCDSRSISK